MGGSLPGVAIFYGLIQNMLERGCTTARRSLSAPPPAILAGVSDPAIPRRIILPLPSGEGGVRAMDSQGKHMRLLDCHTLIRTVLQYFVGMLAVRSALCKGGSGSCR